jgi:ribose transport system ATP-binding protein
MQEAAMQNADMLQMRGISKHYRGTQALDNVDFSASAGEVHAICGENGAGKSTLVKILAGALQRDSGEIMLDGQPLNITSPNIAHEHGIYAVYQEFSLIPHLSITENVLLGQMPTSALNVWVDWPEAHRRAQSVLESIGFRGLDVHKQVSQLSVPHQQLVEIAKAVLQKPRILILDEPSAVLSHEEHQRLFELIRMLKAQSTLILYISHRLDEVFEIADRITVLKDGELVGTVRPQDIDQAGLIRMMVGRTLDEIYAENRSTAGEELLRVSQLSRQGVFDRVSFSLSRREILGVFGLIGSGRTEIARCLFGADAATSGEISLKGQAVHLRKPEDGVRAGIAFLTEDRKRSGLVLSASIRDNISLAAPKRMSRWSILSPDEQDKLVRAAIKELNIRPPDPARLVRQLSGGNQQKVALAKWLLTSPEIFILDEPCRGVDVATKVEIYRTMRDLTERGAGILLISSEMLEILGMSDRILVIREGRIVGELSREEASEERLLALAAGVTMEKTDANVLIQ